MRQLLIGKSGALNYASSKTSTTVNTALTPDTLADGAIGIYAMLNSGQLQYVLVTTSNVSTYIGTTTHLVFAQGTTTGAYVSEKVRISEVSRVFGKENEVARPSVSFIGYDGVSGTTLLGTIGNTDTGIVEFQGKKSLVGVQEYGTTYDSGRLPLGATAYDVFSQLVPKINTDTDNAWALTDVTANGTFGLITLGGTTPTIILTKGSNVVTLGGTTPTHDVAVGNFVSINNTPFIGTTPSITIANNATAPTTGATGIVYKVTAITTTSFTLDRVYTGETQTLSAANVTALWIGKNASVSSQYGMRVIGSTPYEQLFLAAGGVLQYSSITYLSGAFPGSGTVMDITKLQFETQIGMGYMNTVDGNIKPPTSRVDATKVYDKYFIDSRYKTVSSFTSSTREADSYFTIVAFESGNNNTATRNQKDFDTIITTLCPIISSDVVLTA